MNCFQVIVFLGDVRKCGFFRSLIFIFGEKTRVIAPEYSEVVIKGGFLTISGDQWSRRISKLLTYRKPYSLAYRRNLRLV